MRRVRVLRLARVRAFFGSCLFLAAGAILSTFLAFADTPNFPTTPFLRPNPNTHTTTIRRISVDRDERFVATGSEDKTVRIWNLRTGRLEQVLRVPIAQGNPGKVYAVALSPDGTQVAVSGWTGFGSGDQIIYIFDRQSGNLGHMIKDLPNVVLHLTYSQDGRYLAAALARSNGLRVYETERHEKVGEDKYGDDSFGADFDSTGRLVTTSYDGHIRLYSSENFSKPRLKQASLVKKPYGVAFSPGGQLIAVGYRDSTRVDVLAADTLELKYSANTKPFRGGDLSKVAWSQDGKYLFAGGRYNESGLNPVIRWSEGGRGSVEKYSLAKSTVVGIQPLADGSVVIGAADPLVALYDANSMMRWVQSSEQADLRAQEGQGDPGIQLSKTGDVADFGFEYGGKKRARFSIRESQLDLKPTRDASLKGPRLSAPGLEVTNWNDKYNPEVNRKALSLENGERSRALAITPDGKRLVLGTDWWLRVYDANGKELDKKQIPGVAWAVNVTPDGRKVVAGFGDGTLRWYALGSNGKLSELLSLYALPDGRWVLWTPTGYYQASAGAEDLIGWHVNNGAERAPDFFGVSRFRDQFYRSDVIAKVLEAGDERTALRLADEVRGQKTVIRNVRALRPPVVSILAPAPGHRATERKLTLTYEARSETGPITNIEARVGARRARVLDHTPSYRDNRRQVIGQMTVEIPAADTVVELLAYNKNGPSQAARYTLNWSGTPDHFKPDLYVLAVGVSDYPGEGIDLKYAAKDARDFARAIKEQEGELYKRVRVRLLEDEGKVKPTREAILDGLDWIQRETTSRDVAVVYLAGHGVNDSQGHYRFLPANYEPGRLQATSIKLADLKEYLGAISGKTILFFDTCYSGNALKVWAGSKADVDRVANELADAGVGIIVFASTTGGAFARGLDGIKQGAFTKAILEGIEAESADFTRDSYVSVSELEKYISDRVKVLTRGEQKPVTTKPKAIEDWNFIHVPGYVFIGPPS